METNYRDLFPIFENQPELAYLDSAATTQIFGSVLEHMDSYYRTYRANVHRGIYSMSVQATEAYERAREQLAELVGTSDSSEIIFTHGATDGLNQLAEMLTVEADLDEEILLTELDHHSNLLPWQKQAEKKDMNVRWIPVDRHTGNLDLTDLETLLNERTRLVSLTYLSNTLGTRPPVERIIQNARENNAWVVVDASQTVGHLPRELQHISADIIVFSGHKMYGPGGVGAIWARRDILEQLTPAQWGGEMIRSVTKETREWHEIPHRFEAGTPPVAEVIGFGEAARKIKELGSQAIEHHDREMTRALREALVDESGIDLVGPENPEEHHGAVSFTMDGVHPHDIAEIADRFEVAVRAGHHCTMPLMQALGINATTRASVGLYTEERDIEQLVKALKEVKRVFR